MAILCDNESYIFGYTTFPHFGLLLYLLHLALVFLFKDNCLQYNYGHKYSYKSQCNHFGKPYHTSDDNHLNNVFRKFLNMSLNNRHCMMMNMNPNTYHYKNCHTEWNTYLYMSHYTSDNKNQHTETDDYIPFQS